MTLRRLALAAPLVALAVFVALRLVDGAEMVLSGGGGADAGARREGAVPDVAAANEAVRSAPFEDAKDAATAASADIGRGPVAGYALKDARGAALGGAAAFFMKDGAFLGGAVADGAGLVRRTATEGYGEIVVVAAGRAPFRAPVPLGPGRVDVAAPAGATLAGRVLVDDRAPDVAVDLRFVADRATSALVGVPSQALDALASHVAVAAARGGAIPLRSGPDGAFRLEGLAADAAGGIAPATDAYVLVDAPGASDLLRIPRPATDVIVRLRARPCITGRVVRPGTQEPVARARGLAQFVGRRSFREGPFAAGDDGRFRVTVDQDDLRAVLIVVSDAEGRGARRREVTEGLDRRTDLGDVELKALREVPFTAVDHAGAPVAGAIAVAGAPTPAAASAPTDAEGRGVAYLAEDDGVLHVVALGYGAGAADAPPGAASVVVVLPRSNLLEVFVTDAAGAPAGGARIMATCKGRLCEAPGGFTAPSLELAGAAKAESGAFSDYETVAVVRADGAGRAAFTGVVAERTFKIAAIDPFGAAFDEREIALGAGERRRMDLRVAAGRDVVVRVVDGTGAPIVGARAAFSAADVVVSTATTGADGALRVAGVTASRTHLRVERAGYAPFVDDAWEVPAAGEAAVVVLEAGLRVVATVVDGAGRPVAGVEVSAQPSEGGGETLRATTAANGTCELRGLARGPTTYVVDVGGELHRVEQAAEAGDVKVTTPAYGAVRLDVPFPAGAPRFMVVRLRGLAPLGPTRPAVTLVTQAVWNEGRTAGVATFPYVAPGDYEATLDDGTDASRPPLLGPAPVAVVAGATASVALLK